MSEHTPGPWEMLLSDNATPFILHGKDAHLYGIDDRDHLVCVMPAEITRNFNSFANARLITAAPDLLEALKNTVRQIEESNWGIKSPSQYETIVLKQARAAIAKAEGKEVII